MPSYRKPRGAFGGNRHSWAVVILPRPYVCDSSCSCPVSRLVGTRDPATPRLLFLGASSPPPPIKWPRTHSHSPPYPEISCNCILESVSRVLENLLCERWVLVASQFGVLCHTGFVFASSVDTKSLSYGDWAVIVVVPM